MAKASTQSTGSDVQVSTNEFAQMVRDVNYAARTLSETMAFENKTVMHFCNAMLDSALNTAQSIQELEEKGLKEMSKSMAKIKAVTNKKGGAKATKTTKGKSVTGVANKKSAAAISTSKAASPVNSLETSTSNDDRALENMKTAFAAQYLVEISKMVSNMVNAQNNQFMLAQSATTQGIMQIYSLDTIADAIAIAQMLDANQ